MTGREQVNQEGLKVLGQEEVFSAQTAYKTGRPDFLKQTCWANPGFSRGGLRCRPSTICPTNLGQVMGVGCGGSTRATAKGPHFTPAELSGMEDGPPGSILFHGQGASTETHWPDFRPHLQSPPGSSFIAVVNLTSPLF